MQMAQQKCTDPTTASMIHSDSVNFMSSSVRCRLVPAVVSSVALCPGQRRNRIETDKNVKTRIPAVRAINAGEFFFLSYRMFLRYATVKKTTENQSNDHGKRVPGGGGGRVFEGCRRALRGSRPVVSKRCDRQNRTY